MKRWTKRLPDQACFHLAAFLLFAFPAGTMAGEAAVPPAEKPAAQTPALPADKALKLEDAVKLALENHPSLRAAKEKVGAQQAVLGQQFAAYYPTITLGNVYSARTTSGTTGTTAEGFDFFSSQAAFNMTLYNFGKREGTVQSARDTLEATRYNYKTTADSVVLGVKQAFFTYLQAKALVKVRQDTVKDRELLVRQAQGFYEVGTRARIDVVRAEANLYSAQADLISADNAVKVGWVTLKNAMGLPDYPEQPLAEEISVTPVPFSLEQARATAYASRPELKSFEAQRKAQDDQIATARRGHLPDIIFDALYGRRHTSNDGHTNTFPLQPTWQVQLSLNIPIFNGFSTTYKVEESVRNYYSIKAQEDQQKQLVALEVEQSYANVVSTRERIKATEAAAKAAKENLDLANGRYQVGVGSIIEVTDAEATHSSAQTDYIRALYDYKIAETQLIKAMGSP